MRIGEPSPEDSLTILKGLKKTYEEHHGVQYEPEALSSAVKLATRYITDRFLPDKAIDVVDEAGAMVQLAGGTVVDASHVADVVAQWTGVPVQQLSEDESTTLLNIEESIGERVIGQSQAVTAISRAVRRARSGLADASRPVASMIFAGPTGVGKTELAKAVAQSYYGRRAWSGRVEYMESFAVSDSWARPGTRKLQGRTAHRGGASQPARSCSWMKSRRRTQTSSTSCSRFWRMGG